MLVGTLGLAGCQPEPPASSNEGASRVASEAGVQYVTTIPPLAMIVAPVVRTRGSVVSLLQPGDSPHTYDLRPSDVRRVEQSAAVFYGAASLDAWAADLPRAPSVALLGLVPPSARRAFGAAHQAHRALPDESSPDGSLPDKDAAAAHRHAPGNTDPHFWTDPQAVRALLPALADTLCAADAAGCATYRANADSFATALASLDAHLDATLRPVRDVPVMLAQPFFRYFLHRYGPELAGVVAPQPAREPSPRDIHRLAQDAAAHGVRALFVQQSLPPQAARAVSEAAGIPIHTLDPLGGAAERATYDALLKWNAQRIRDALSDAVPSTPTASSAPPEGA